MDNYGICPICNRSDLPSIMGLLCVALLLLVAGLYAIKSRDLSKAQADLSQAKR